MSTATKTLPNFTTQSAAAYKANIDACVAVHDRIAGAFAVHQVTSGSPAPDLAVYVNPGALWHKGALVEVAGQTVSGFTIPTAGQNRVDRVVIDRETGTASRVAGTAVTGSPSATAPDVPAGKIPLAQVYITSADTVVTNDMITDERPPFTTGGTVVRAYTDVGSPTPTWTRPAGLLGVFARVQAGGGGGGGGDSGAGGHSVGGGGGGGGYAEKWIEADALNATEVVQVGSGGTAGSSSGGNGGDGGASSFGSHVSASGGGGGGGQIGGSAVGRSPRGGLGGVGATGDFNCRGGSGQFGVATTASTGFGGNGGDSHLGGGGISPLDGQAADSSSAGQQYGGGGAGATSINGTDRAGSAGAQGIVIVIEVYA